MKRGSELPYTSKEHVLRPDRLRVGDQRQHDAGATVFVLRSDRRRKREIQRLLQLCSTFRQNAETQLLASPTCSVPPTAVGRLLFRNREEKSDDLAKGFLAPTK